MDGGRAEVAAVLRRDDVLLAREHPALARTVRRMAVDATLTAVLPGVVVATSDLSRPEVVALAVARGLPDAVITGAAAARLTFWPELRVDRVTAANARTRARGALVEVVTERIPAELVVTAQGISVACPSLTALDLGGPGIDRALLSRAASLASMGHALDRTPRRPGNRERRRMLHDSRDEPWSEAERLAHAVLRGAGVTGFRTNHPVSCGGATFYLDIAFPSQMVAIEVDGFEVHSRRGQFEQDRRRQTMLTARGWRVLRVTWAQLVDEPRWFVRELRQALSLPA